MKTTTARKPTVPAVQQPAKGTKCAACADALARIVLDTWRGPNWKHGNTPLCAECERAMHCPRCGLTTDDPGAHCAVCAELCASRYPRTSSRQRNPWTPPRVTPRVRRFVLAYRAREGLVGPRKPYGLEVKMLEAVRWVRSQAPARAVA